MLELIRTELLPRIPPPGDPARANALMNLGANLLMAGFEQNHSMPVLDEAVEYCRQGVAATPAGDPRRAAHLKALANLLGRRYKETEDPADLDSAIDTCHEALDAARASPDWDPVPCHAALGDLLGLRYVRLRNRADLDRAITAYRRAVELTPTGHPLRPAFVTRLTGALAVLGEPTSDTTLLHEATQTAENPALLDITGHAAGNRFTETDSIGDLDRAVTAYRKAVDTTSPGDPQRVTRLQTLGRTLAIRAGLTGSTQDLDDAVTTFRTALAIAPAHNQAGLEGDFGRVLADRYVCTDRRDDLDEAFTLLSSAIEITSPDRTTHLIDFARTATLRFSVTGDSTDLKRGVAAGRQAVKASESDHNADHSQAQAVLGRALMFRFAQIGGIADLDAAIDAYRVSVDTAPSDHPSRGDFITGLGTALQLRFQRTLDPHDLDASITAARTGVDVRPTADPGRPESLAILGNGLRLRFESTGAPADLDEGIAACRAGLKAIEPDHPNRSVLGMSLGILLNASYTRTSDLSDLDEAIAVSRDGVYGDMNGPDLGPRLTTLGNLFGTRYVHTEDETDLTEAMICFLRATTMATAAPSWRIQAARTAATIIAPDAPGQAARLLEIAVRLLPEVAAKRLTRDDHYHALGTFTGLASDAASLTLDDPERHPADRALHALQLLEEGRAVLLSEALNTRGDLTELRRRHPDLAARFADLRDRLDQPATSPELLTVLAGTHHGTDRHDLADRFAAVLSEIRTQDGFASFGLAPSVDDLLAVAEQGPVIVCNVTEYRSDALLVTTTGITCVPLPGVVRDDLVDRIAAFHRALGDTTAADSITHRRQAQHVLTETLEWLWDNVTEPVLNALGHDATPDGTWPRVWWAPGGLLGLLPLHAAGYHHDESRRTVIDRVVSSYTPTVRALHHARNHAPSSTGPGRGLVVAVPDLYEGARLHHVDDEVSALRNHLPDVVILAGTEQITPTKANVLAHLSSCRITHFACHGYNDPTDPSRSHLLLNDPLTVADLHTVHLDNAHLAYLSACRTASIDVTTLADEAIHLTSAFQLAGFPHVAGTLWAIQDEIAAKAADSFYQTLNRFGLDHAAQALHTTVRDLRDQFPRTPSLWAAYLHAGA